MIDIINKKGYVNMKRIIAVVLTVIFVTSVFMPISSFAGSDFSSASTITMDTDTDCNISFFSTTQYYVINAQYSGKYTFYSSGNYDTVAYLYDSSTTELTNDDNGAGDGKNFSISYYLISGNTYYFGVKLASGRFGSFTVRLNSPFANTAYISLNSTSTCNISTSGAVQYYRYVPTISGDYIFYSSGSYDTYSYLYDNAKTQVADNDNGGSGNNFSLRYNLLAYHAYYFVAGMRSSSATGSFSIRLEQAPSASITSTNTLTTSQTVTLSFSDDLGVSGYYWGTNRTYSSNMYTSILSTVTSVTKTISSAGTYYLTAKDTSGNLSSTASVTFYKTTFNSNGGSVSPSYIITKGGSSITLPTPIKNGFIYDGWSTSSNATSGSKTITPSSNSTYYAVWTAESISSGNEKTVSISNPGECKYFKFVPTTSAHYSFYSTGSYDTFGYIYDSNMRELSRDNNGGDSKNFSLTYVMRAGNTYYLCAKLYNVSDIGRFNVKLEALPDTTSPIVGTSSTNNVATSQTVTLSFSDDVGIAGYYWGTSNNYLNNGYTATSSTTSTAMKTVSSSGTYYLTAKDTSGNLSNTVSLTFHKTTLDENGGSVSPNYIITKSGNSVNLPTPTKSGNDFVGWGIWHEEAGWETDYSNALKKITVNSNETYLAIWSSTHKYYSVIQKATLKSDGWKKEVCEYCGRYGKVLKTFPHVKSVVLSSTEFTYNGNNKTPKVTVKDKNGKAISASNYTVTYPKVRKAVGTYKIKITFKGYYSGSINKTFKINPPPTNFSRLKALSKTKLKISWKKISGVNGYQITYALNKSFNKGAKTITIKKPSTTSANLSVKHNVKYYARIRTYKTVGGKNYYSSWKSINFRIK